MSQEKQSKNIKFKEKPLLWGMIIAALAISILIFLLTFHIVEDKEENKKYIIAKENLTFAKTFISVDDVANEYLNNGKETHLLREIENKKGIEPEMTVDDIKKIEIAQNQVNMLYRSVMDYKFRTKSFPTKQEGLQVLLKPIGLAKQSVLKDLSLDPWGNEYLYQSPTKENKLPSVMSYGKDGKLGGNGPNKDIREERK